ncbi:uncharacterized protein [Periplaneta americana]|uniref:uncharacterized protein isoform X1 n=2 Tax=Periplaneta americana TaxID=6978 RepID=UPI0037E72B49
MLFYKFMLLWSQLEFVIMGTLVCPLCCDEEFPSQLSLRYHLLSITDNMYCPDCNNRFDSILQLADHLDGMCGKAHIESNFEDDTSESDMIIAEGSAEEGEIDTQVVSELNNTANVTAEYLEEVPSETLPEASETRLDNSDSIQLVSDTDIEETAVSVIENEYVDVIEQKVEVIHVEDARDVIEIDSTNEQSRYVDEESIGVEEKLSENLSVLPTSNAVEAGNEDCDEEMVGSELQAVPENKVDALAKQEECGAYACSSCGITFTSVMEHIRLYHDGQEVVVEVPDADKAAFDKLVGTSNEVVASNGEERKDSNFLLECSVSKQRSDSGGTMEGTYNELGFSETSATCPEKHSASNKGTVKPYHWHKEKTRVVADEEKIKKIVPCVKKFLVPLDTIEDHVTSELKCVSKEVKIDKFWETKFDENATLDVNGSNIKKETRRMLVKKDTRTSIEKLFSGNFLLKGTGGRGTRPGPYLGVSRVPEVKVIMSPGDKGTENAISVFTCSTCQKEFGNVPAFERHSCTVAKTCSVVCKLCETDISDVKAMRIHMETIHNMKTENPGMSKRKYNMQTLSQPVKCESCDMTFTTMRALKLHGKMHDRVDAKAPLECPVCHNVCSSNRTLKQHMKVHSKPLPIKKPDDSTGAEDEDQVLKSDKGGMLGLLVCKVCYKSFSKNEDLRAHWQEHSNKDVGGDGEEEEEEKQPLEQLVEVIKEEVLENQSEETKKKTVPCVQCHKEIDKSCKEEHMAKHFSAMRYDCPVCNKSFSKHGHLIMHMRIHRGVKEYSCIHCGKMFANMNLLRTHIQSHMVQRPYLCGFCGRGFFRPHDKVEHERIHTGEKPYPCSVCGMRFRVRYCLTLHMRRHTGIRPYNCKMCDKTFRTGTAYKAHIKIHLDERAYKCPFCPKKFNTMIQLAGHKNSHTKPYSCVECNRPFSSLYAVRKHMTSHEEGISGKDPLKFQCHVCGASYARKFALRDHLKSHGRNIPPAPDKTCSDDSSSDMS